MILHKPSYICPLPCFFVTTCFGFGSRTCFTVCCSFKGKTKATAAQLQATKRFFNEREKTPEAG